MKKNNFIIYSSVFEKFISEQIEKTVYLQVIARTKNQITEFIVILSAFADRGLSNSDEDRVHQFVSDIGTCFSSFSLEMDRLSKLSDECEKQLEKMLTEKGFIVRGGIISNEQMFGQLPKELNKIIHESSKP